MISYDELIRTYDEDGNGVNYDGLFMLAGVMRGRKGKGGTARFLFDRRLLEVYLDEKFEALIKLEQISNEKKDNEETA